MKEFFCGALFGHQWYPLESGGPRRRECMNCARPEVRLRHRWVRG